MFANTQRILVLCGNRTKEEKKKICSDDERVCNMLSKKQQESDWYSVSHDR